MGVWEDEIMNWSKIIRRTGDSIFKIRKRRIGLIDESPNYLRGIKRSRLILISP